MAEAAPYVDNTLLTAELARCVAEQHVTPELLALVCHAELYVPLVVEDGVETPALYAVEHEDGVLVAAFSSMAELERADPQAGAVTVMTGGQIAAMIVENDTDNLGVRLAIDLAGTGVGLDPNEVITGGPHQHADADSATTAGISSDTLPSGPRVYLGLPASPPLGLIERLSAACGSSPAVISGHLLQAVTEDPDDADREPESALLVGLILDDATDEAGEERVLEMIGPAIGDPGQPVDVMTLPLTPPAGEPLPGPALRQTEAFYRR